MNFDSPKLRLAWAKKNISELTRKRDGFIDEAVWSESVDLNSDRSTREYKVRLTQPFPDIFSELTSYAVGNLRSCLDHATHASARCSGKKNPHANFPFGDDADGLEKAIKKWNCKDIPPDVVTVIRRFKPCRTENPLLWAINRIANLDKHALVSPMAAGLSSLMFTGSKAKSTPPLFIPALPLLIPSESIWRADKNEIVYAVSAPEVNAREVNPGYNVHVKFDIAFGKIDVVERLPAVGVLNDMVREVESILEAIETETRRLFPQVF